MSKIDFYLEQLNERQREAVLENSRPLLALAGAGSGKTRVITTKIAYAVEVLKILPYQILAVTFTNKAANEMRERVGEMLQGHDLKNLQMRTFHSFGAWFLRRYGSAIGLSSSFTIYDDDDSLSLLATCYPQFKKQELAPYAKAIALAKDRALSSDDGELEEIMRDGEFAKIFETYEEKLRSVGNVDFADLILLPTQILRNVPEIRDQIHARFKMILVDEYQDSNIAQFKLLQQLVGPESFICVVGDDDQSIYRFRGAEVKNILSFPEVYANTKVIALEQNYRSSKNILAIAQAVISHNSGRHAKQLWTENPEGKKSRLITVLNESDEAKRCATMIAQSGEYDKYAILYRTNGQSRTFETLFSRLGIPYKVVGALRFYDREEIKDALALLYLMLNPNDVVNFNRIINKPARGLGAVSQQRIADYALQENLSILAGCKKAATQGILSGKTAQEALSFATMFDEALLRLKNEGNISCLNYLLEASKLHEYYVQQDEQNRTYKVENLGQLVNAVNDYPDGEEGLLLFLESLTLDRTRLGNEDPSEKPGVTLITMHNTKGLEFDRVFITGLETGIFPGPLCKTNEDLEEERRIFYVAITRARHELVMLSCRQRMLWGRTNWQLPSPFLSEIPIELLEIEESFPIDSSYQGYDALGEKRRRNSNLYSSAPPKKEMPPQVKGRKFSLGERVFHEEYGEGLVQDIRSLREREIVDVVFSSGRRASFFASAPALEKLGSSW